MSDSTINIGERVGLISHDDGHTIYIFGYGTYIGTKVPDVEVPGNLADVARKLSHDVPFFKLDGSDDIIYGCECWWKSEDDVKEICDGFDNVESISIHSVRESILNGDFN